MSAHDATSVLESPHTHDGVVAPLWEHAKRLQRDPSAVAELLLEVGLPERLQAFQDLVFHAQGVHLARAWEVAERLCRAGFGTDVASWAAKRADALLDRWSYGVSARGGVQMLLHVELRLPVFLPLARAGIAIEERWEPLFPMLLGPYAKWMHECLAAVPRARRDVMLAAEFEAELDPANVLEYSLELLHSHPSRWLVEQVLTRAGADYRRTDEQVIRLLVETVAPNAALAAWLDQQLPLRHQVVYEIVQELLIETPSQTPEYVQPVVEAALGTNAAFGPDDRVRLLTIKAVGTPRSYMVVLRRHRARAYRAGTTRLIAAFDADHIDSADDEVLAKQLQQTLSGRF